MSIEKRLNESDYKNTYDKIEEIYSSNKSREIDKLEADCINLFSSFKNCSNIKRQS